MINTFFKQILIFFLVIFAFLYLTNCATPHPILRMKPMQNIENSQQVFWKNGGSYIQEVQNEIGIRIGFSFFDKSQKLFLMEFEFVNFSANPILISPEKFYYTTFDTIQHQITKDAKENKLIKMIFFYYLCMVY
ncbi:MAG: hypothetical protein EAZ20_03265 [Bacteroidetes bacterium]|nr:MAG: hypothetical protein EAZ20_03265 [Bacteroidota bacterium]